MNCDSKDGHANEWSVHAKAVASLIKLFKRDPENATIASTLIAALKREEVVTRFIILKGLEGMTSRAALGVDAEALRGAGQMTRGSGNTYENWTHLLRGMAAENLMNHPLWRGAKQGCTPHQLLVELQKQIHLLN